MKKKVAPNPINNAKGYTASLRPLWMIFSRGSIFVVTVITSFLNPIPVLNAISGVTSVKALAIFLAAILTGLFFFLDSKCSHSKTWAFITGVSLMLTIGGFFSFQRMADQRLCAYGNDYRVVGTELTPQGNLYSFQHPGISCSDLLMDFGGKESDIWTESSLSKSRLFLSSLYLLTFSLGTITILSLLQTVRTTTSSNSSSSSNAICEK